MPETRGDDPRTATTLAVGAIGVVLLVVVVIALEAFYFATAEREHRRKVVEAPQLELERIRAEQRELLAHYRWVDEQAGVVAVPIDRAIELVVAEAAREARP